MVKVTEGMKVRIKAREASSEEIKTGRYLPHLGGLTGKVLCLYSDSEIAVQIDLASLPASIRERHLQQQEAMQNRWLESLSEEARSRLTPEEKIFQLNYVALVSANDLEPLRGGGSEKAKAPRLGGTKVRAEGASSGARIEHSSKAKGQRAVGKQSAATLKSASGKAPSSQQAGAAASPVKSPSATHKKQPSKATTSPAKTQLSLLPQPSSRSGRKPSPSSSGEEVRKRVKQQSPSPPTPQRLTSKDLERAEAEYLEMMKKQRSS